MGFPAAVPAAGDGTAGGAGSGGGEALHHTGGSWPFSATAMCTPGETTV